jgi:hypothetical protein
MVIMEKLQTPTNPSQDETDIPPYTPATCDAFATLTISKSDRIRLISFPPIIVDAVQEIIQSTWPRGIQNTREYNGAHEFKLCGWPWGTSRDESLLATRLMCRILEMLYTHGWVISLPTGISRHLENKAGLIFRHQQQEPNPCEWVAISFNSGDMLHFVDAPTSLVQAVAADLSLVTKSHQPHKVQDVYELKIYGQPWNAFGQDSMQAWKLAMKLMESLEAHGFSICASVSQNGGSEDDTWYCCRRGGWIPGVPVHDG